MTKRQRILAALLVLSLVALASPRPGHSQAKVAADRHYARRPAVPGVHGLVTAGHPLASMAGMQILLKGGNAFDASVAVLAALNVVRPQMSGAAGNGFATIYQKSSGRVYSLSATGAAPQALQPEKLSAEQLHSGMQAGVVPGLFGGWVALLDRFGTMSLAEVLEPAIDYAANGHPIEATVVRSIGDRRSVFRQFPASLKMFLPQGRLPIEGEMFTMPDLAATFRKLVDAEQAARRRGQSRSDALQAAFDRFYKGDIAQEMARFYQENGGPFAFEDFAAYEPLWTDPVHIRYRGYDVYSSPSTSRGGIEVMMQLNLIEGYDLAAHGHNSAETLHLIIESIKLAKSDVYRYVADPKSTRIPLDWMLSIKYAATRRKQIQLGQAMSYPEPGRPPEFANATSLLGSVARPQGASQTLDERSQPGSTTSFSVADRRGNVVACTPTHGSAFGTAVVVGNTGLTFNNGTRIGSTAPYPDHVNYARGGQVPLLNNSPVIVLKDGKFLLALGTPGGETIGQTQFQVLLNVLDFGMPIQEAVAAPRIALTADPSFYKPGAAITVRVEGRVPPGVAKPLENIGHEIARAGDYSLGSMQGIHLHPETATMTAGADPRRVAYAIGW